MMQVNKVKLRAAIKSIAWSRNQYLCLINEEGKILMLNRRMQKELNLKNPQQVNINFFDLLSSVQRENSRKALQYSMINHIPYSMELQFTTQLFPVRGHVCHVDDNEGAEQVFVWSLSAESKDRPGLQDSNGHEGMVASVRLKIAEERLQYLNRITNDALWEWDMVSGEILRNNKLIELIGKPDSTERGHSWWLSRLHPDDRNELSGLLKETTEKNLNSWQIEYRFLCMDGEYRNMIDHGYTFYENGLPVKMIGSLRDVTSEKLMLHILMEEKLRKQKVLSENTLRVQEEERSRFGRELHDNVNQILTSIRLYLGMLTPSEKKEKDIKSKTIEYCDLAIEEIRRLSREMVTPNLEDDTLIENIQRIIDDTKKTTAIKINFKHNIKQGTLSCGKKLALFRTVQEQMKNIIKYSKATLVDIRMETLLDMLKMTIKDNGVGFDPEIKKKGIGFTSMQERVKYHSGVIHITSSLGKGTKVVLEIPLEVSHLIATDCMEIAK